MKLTIGMAAYNDYEGVYFTIQALRMFHDLTDCEIIIVDNYGDSKLKNFVDAWLTGKEIPVRYIEYLENVGTTQPREQIFKHSEGELTICIDSHVMLMPGSLDRLWEGDDLIHGVMLYDDLKTPVTHMDPEWRSDMWGVWATQDPIPDEPFEIPMHGLGLFGCRTEAWLGFHPEYRGFGADEGYIHEKYRRAGRKVLCLPWMRWIHLFRNGTGYPINIQDRVRNYLLGFKELEMDPAPIYDHFGVQLVNRIEATM